MLSNLTAEQRNSLQAMPQVLGLAADIAHAAVTIYLPGENKKFFNVYKQEQPMTQVGNVRPDMTVISAACRMLTSFPVPTLISCSL